MPTFVIRNFHLEYMIYSVTNGLNSGVVEPPVESEKILLMGEREDVEVSKEKLLLWYERSGYAVKEVKDKLIEHGSYWRKLSAIGDGNEREFKEMAPVSSQIKYAGEWDKVKQIRDGRGIEFEDNGTVYEGIVRANRRHGKGRIIYQNGNIYEGEFSNGYPLGKGTITI